MPIGRGKTVLAVALLILLCLSPVQPAVGETVSISRAVSARGISGDSPNYPPTIFASTLIPPIIEYPLPVESVQPTGITTGPDGNLWFTDLYAHIGRITPGGDIKLFSLTCACAQKTATAITVGPDDNLWFGEEQGGTTFFGGIGRITTNGDVAEWSTPFPYRVPIDITAGPDGNLWFTEGSFSIGRITTDGTITEFFLPTASNISGITVGPDGNLWFTAFNEIGRITTAGAVTEFPLPVSGDARYITAGPDGNLWFTVYNDKIGRITTSGGITEFPLPTPGSYPFGITLGPDGNLWFTEIGGNRLGRITPTGIVDEFPIPTAGSQPWGITRGPDGNIWFTEQLGNKIGKILLSALPPAAFLDLPFDYSYIKLPQAAAFSQVAQGNVDGTGTTSRVNSWFDHNLPDYGKNQIVRTWLGTYTGLAATSRDSCALGVSCYDGHNGIDFDKRVKDASDEPVFAAARGIVAEVWNNCPSTGSCPPDKAGSRGAPYGNYVLINHSSNGYATFYGHLKSVNVGKGDPIADPKAKPIGIMGGSGGFPIHLHFGLYYDQYGKWKEDEIVDPYGWPGLGTDPWSAPSRYMWKYPIWWLQSINASGAIIISLSGGVSINVPPGAVASTLTFKLWDAPPVAVPSGQLRTAGRSFLLQILEWLGSSGSNSMSPAAPLGFSQPVTITASYSVTSTQHLNLNQLAMYRWSNTSSTWVGLTSTVNISNNQVTAQTTDIGSFDLQAPLLCLADSSEPDDTVEAAKTIPTDGTQISRLFDIADDEDWGRFNAMAGMKYVIQTSNLAAGVDTMVQLYDINGANVLATNDNYGGTLASRIDWIAPQDGTYFIRVSRTASSAYGCNATYKLSVTQMNQLYLPLILNNQQ